MFTLCNIKYNVVSNSEQEASLAHVDNFFLCTIVSFMCITQTCPVLYVICNCCIHHHFILLYTVIPLLEHHEYVIYCGVIFTYIEKSS